MVLAYEIILLIIISISFLFAIDSRRSQKDLAQRATALCIAAILSFIISSVVL